MFSLAVIVSFILISYGTRNYVSDGVVGFSLCSLFKIFL